MTAKYLLKVPVKRLIGPYRAHELVYAACDGGRPLWRRFDDHALVLTERPSEAYPCKSYDPALVAGTRLRFDLLAEMSKADGKPEQGGRSRRVDPVLEAWIASGKRADWRQLGFDIGIDWLQSRQVRYGFELEQVDMADYAPLEFLRNGKPIRIGTVGFAGMMKVTDADLFRTALLGGIGRSKAWGCGLLLCKKVNRGAI
jgi:CRISPR system Cascade subunit CasE